MKHAKHTHYLVCEGVTNELDMNACILTLNSRGRYVLRGDMQGETRRLLADELGGGVLADLLRDCSRPIVADSGADHYVFWEV